MGFNIFKHDYYDNWDKKFNGVGDVVDELMEVQAMVRDLMDMKTDDDEQLI